MFEFQSMPGHLIRRAHQVSSAIFAEAMADQAIDLTPFQFAALAAVGAHPGIDQASVARQAACDKATMGGVINRLVEKGLLRREQSKTDRRARVLELTDEGDQVLNRTRSVVADIQNRLTDGLSDSERATLVDLLQRIALDRDAE